jgi:hypothetical protein
MVKRKQKIEDYQYRISSVSAGYNIINYIVPIKEGESNIQVLSPVMMIPANFEKMMESFKELNNSLLNI